MSTDNCVVIKLAKMLLCKNLAKFLTIAVVIPFLSLPTYGDVTLLKPPLVRADFMSMIRHATLRLKNLNLQNVAKGFNLFDASDFFHETKINDILQNLKNDNSSCAHSLEKLLVDIYHRESYALKLLDSWGKLESGIAQGNVQFLGRFYECQSVKNSSLFNGKWCSLSNSPVEHAGDIMGAGLSLGICIPDTCSSSNITDIIKGFLPANKSVNIHITCPMEQNIHNWDALNIVAVVITCLLVLFVVIGTLYTVCEKHWNRTDDDDDVPLINITEEKDNSSKSKLAEAFSVTKNTEFLLNTKKTPGTIHCLHGMRFISMTWVILGHTFAFPLFYMDNLMDMAKFYVNHISFLAVASGTLSVDSFFYLSGLLVSFLGLRELDKQNGKMSVWKMYLHRYLRLTPAYAYMILFSVTIFGMLGDGPYFAVTAAGIRTTCSKYWWSNLLYINNLHPSVLGEECFGLGWYLANDTQFYLLSPLFLILLYRKPKIGVAALVISTVVSMSITGAISTYYALPIQQVGIAQLAGTAINGASKTTVLLGHGNATDSETDKFGSDTYGKPWCRMGVYFIGMITGYILHTTKGNIKMNKVTVALGWLITTVTALALVYGVYGHVHAQTSPPLNVSSFYNAVERPLWAVCLAWVTVACVSGYGGPVNSFLSWSVFIPLSRLTYTCYLGHPMVLYLIFATQEVSLHFSVVTMACYFLATVVLTHGFAYFVSMTVEAPMSSLQRWLIPRPKNNLPPSSQIVNGYLSGQRPDGDDIGPNPHKINT